MESINKKYKPRISIVIPAYNEESNIEETLRAIKNQICNFSYEIIVVDGQSTDKTISVAKIMRRYINRLKEVGFFN